MAAGPTAKSENGTKKGVPPPAMKKSDMKLLLGKSKTAPVNCAIGVSADARFGLIIMHKTRKPKALQSDLVKTVPGAKSIRWGTVSIDADVDPKLVRLQLNKPIANVSRRLIRALKVAGFTKVEISS